MGSGAVSAAKRKGTAWERRVADYAHARGFPWDRAPLRGSRDLLDIQGCLPDGWLIGTKNLSPETLQARLSSAMDQCRKAMANLDAITPPHWLEVDVIPVQVVQRRNHRTGRAYVVLEFDDFLRLAELRREWDNREGK